MAKTTFNSAAETTPEAKVAAAPDPFDLDNLRIDQDFIETAGVKKLLTTIPVRKPNPQDFVRVHPDPNYREKLNLIEWKDEGEMFLVPKTTANALIGETIAVCLYAAINRQGVLFFWPVRLPSPDGRVLEWHRSAAEGAELAMSKWVRIKSNRSLGAYEIFQAEGVIPEPDWPAYPYKELLRIAFRERIVSDMDHSVVKRLRGLL